MFVFKPAQLLGAGGLFLSWSFRMGSRGSRDTHTSGRGRQASTKWETLWLPVRHWVCSNLTLYYLFRVHMWNVSMCVLPLPSGRSESVTLYFIPSHPPLWRLSYSSTSSTDIRTPFNTAPGHLQLRGHTGKTFISMFVLLMRNSSFLIGQEFYLPRLSYYLAHLNACSFPCNMLVPGLWGQCSTWG